MSLKKQDAQRHITANERRAPVSDSIARCPHEPPLLVWKILAWHASLAIIAKSLVIGADASLSGLGVRWPDINN